MSRPLENISRRTRFDDCAEVHHEHAVGEMPDSLEIMADEQVTESPLALDTARSCRMRRRVETSSEAVGSSRTTIFGSTASARAMPTRWRCPPLSWRG